jgi:hypothetical protein
MSGVISRLAPQLAQRIGIIHVLRQSIGERYTRRQIDASA